MAEMTELKSLYAALYEQTEIWRDARNRVSTPEMWKVYTVFAEELEETVRIVSTQFADPR